MELDIEHYEGEDKEQRHIKRESLNAKERFINVPKGTDWLTNLKTAEVISFRQQTSYVNPGEKNYTIRFRYKEIGLENVTFSYHFMWSDLNGLERNEYIIWWIDENKIEISRQIENEFNEKVNLGDTNIRNKIRKTLERKLEQMLEYKMFVPFIFTE
ncbi:hypothetical protein COA01_15545 [Bacillus cereus]|uniref:hypothetical protein n=1 Tax=Bacillus cereus TaxID=1396 RepID=UPI000BFC2EAE|nr:hypothetical protein [Bacillus cereus]PGP20952.1 hypothetical protein COA01_15545 [Bacillus cereus]